MTEEKEKNEEKKSQETKEMLKVGGIPSMASIDDVLKALGVLLDKGGRATISELVVPFGGKGKKRVLSAALNASEAYNLVDPHSGRAPFALSEKGKKFLSTQEETGKKVLLFQEFVSYKHYRDILIQMKRASDNAMKKEAITTAWANIAGGGTLSTRKSYTTTFASVGDWCGAIKDTGKTCSLTPEGEKGLEQVLKGEAVRPEAALQPQKEAASAVQLSAIGATHCPFCTKPDTAPKTEKLLDKVVAGDTTTLIIERTFHCRGCSREFTHIVQQVVGLKPEVAD